jgi:hypothetical protein
MKNDHTKVTDLSENQEKAIIEAKEVLASKQDVLMAIGQIQAFNNMKKYATVAELVTFKKIKESKQYKGLVYTDEDGKSATVADIKDVCTIFFGCSYRSMQEDEQNLEVFGQDFFESSQSMGLGSRELRKLRQLPEESQQLVINSEAVDLSDKELVKELIEDLNFKQITEKSALENQLKEAQATVVAARENSATTQQELNQIKEIEVKRRFTQNPWKHQTLDNLTAMMESKVSIEQGINQLGDVFDNLRNDESLDDKARDLIARSLLSEAQAAHALVNSFTNELFGVLGGRYRPDISAEDTFVSLQSEDDSTEQGLVD